MSARLRRTAAAIVLTAAVTALLPTVANAATRAPATVNGTKGNGLTISDGTQYVVMNGTRVNFGTIVRDLAWNPSGSKAAFVDGNGNLDVANANGSDRVTVARNPGHGTTWSHPTWQVAPAVKDDGIRAKDNLIFASEQSGTVRLETVAATGHDAAPQPLALNHYSGDGEKPLPLTGNTWPSAAGGYGSSVYENTHTGEVYIRDDYLRQQGGALVQGSEPALSPNGDEVVFVRSVAGHDHIFVETFGATKNTVKDLTPHGTSYYTEPTWSANGATIAFRTPNGTDTMPANGSHAPVQVSTYTGLAAYRA